MATWNIDTAHSDISFTVRHMVFAKVRGRFGKLTATIEADGAELDNARVTAAIEAASIDTGVADRDAHLRGPDFFDAEKCPTLTFVSTQVERKSAAQLVVSGDLTIRGVTKPVTLDVTYNGTGKDPWGNERLGFTANGAINRKDFGLTWNQALEAGGVLVGDKIEIELEVQAVKAAAAKAA